MTSLGDLHDDLRAVARDLLAAADADAGPAWELLATSGWLGLEVAEPQGGAGATFAEVAVVLEEMGRAATTSPYLGSVVLGIGLLRALEPTDAGLALQASVASGDTRVAVGLTAGDDGSVPYRLEATSGRRRLRGQATFVPDAGEADRLLLPAVDDDGTSVVVVIDREATGVDVRDQPVLDTTRRFATVTVHGVDVDPVSVWRPADDRVGPIPRLRDRAAVAVAVDSLGLAEAMLDATVAYAAARHQFGRPIGSFQAVKHACADRAVELAVARELVGAAVRAVATDPSADGGVAVAMAAAYASEAAVRAAGSAMQLHGGIGYTWESGIHTYLKRAALNRSLFGSPAAHRRRLARRYV